MSADQVLVASLLQAYADQQELLGQFMSNLQTNLSVAALESHVHSMRVRIKDPDHLRDKLLRKMTKCEEEGVPFEITPETLLTQVNDLVGVRLLHLHTEQIKSIDSVLREIFEEHHYGLIEGPFARTWDDESRAFYDGCGIETQVSPTMYTSVHYVIGSNSKTPMTCEIQVRTLMEEVWGEVDHLINYPHPTTVLTTREQLRVLARVASSATRLVDSIFRTHPDLGESTTQLPEV